MNKLIFIILGCFLLSGCAGVGYRAADRFEGKSEPPEVAILKVGQSSDIRRDVVMAYRGLDILFVDDVTARKSSFGYDYVNEIWLLPGKHTVTFRYLRNTSYAYFKLWFIAEEGKTYFGKYDSGRSSVSMWIEDAKTKERTGGIVGSDDEPE